jgi:phage shock protein PspC (stress-responsive transcriptional regulator)
MKKTVKINLSVIVFNLDEDAYQELKNYLDSIISRFRDMEEGNEIIADIESRIAEIFQTKINEKKQVITIRDVNDVIAIMGRPEDFYDSETMEGEPSTGKEEYSWKRHRRLYRDPDNAILGGVAAGLAAYFGIEAWIIRLLLVILTFPLQVILIVYIILWIVVPKAETAAQKLEMRGEKVTVSNIEKTIKEEYESVKENVKRVKQSKEYKKTRNVLDEIFHALGQIILVVLKLILFIIGIGLIIAGITAIMGLTSVFFFRHALFPLDIWPPVHVYPLAEMFNFLSSPETITLFSFALFMAIFIPVIALIYGGIKLIFRFKANDKVIGLTGLVLWLLSVIFLVTIPLYEGSDFATTGLRSESNYLDPFNSDTLRLCMNNEPGIEGFREEWYDEDNDEWHIISDENKMYGKVDLDIESSGNEQFEVIVKKSSKGRSRVRAIENAENTTYRYIQDDGTLILDPYFSLSKVFKWRSPETEVVMKIPEGKYIYLDKNTKYFLDDIEDMPHSRIHEAAGKTLQLKDGEIMISD